MAIVSRLPQFPETEICVSLYQKVSNASQLRSRISELPYALIDARTVCSMEQIYSAIYRAFIESRYGKLKTKSLHAECLYCLSPTSNIGEALRNFGIKDDSTALVVIRILTDGTQDEGHQKLDLEGDEVELDDKKLAHFMDNSLVKKVCLYFGLLSILRMRVLTFAMQIYKLNNFPETSQEELSRAVVNSIQLRGL